MNIWKMEMDKINKLRKSFYRPPLPLKKQRIITRASKPGKVKVFSKEEISLFVQQQTSFY